jgi:hypothetical protein
MTNADACKALLDSQAAKGLSKYGAPLELSDATVSQLARHGAEEMADALAYFVALETKAKAMEAELSTLRAALAEHPTTNVTPVAWLEQHRALIRQCNEAEPRDCSGCRWTAKLIATTPRPGISLAQLEPIAGSLPDLRGDLPACRYAARCERSEASCETGSLAGMISLADSHLVACRRPL